MMAISMITATMTIRSTGMISVPSIGKPITAKAACSKRGNLHCEPGLAGVQRVAPDIITTDREHAPHGECSHNRDLIETNALSGNSAQMTRIAELEWICAELYQVIGSLADHAGCFDHPDVQAALDNASKAQASSHRNLLPWPRRGAIQAGPSG